MKKMILLGIMLCFGGAAWALPGATNISYQGKLLDKNGIPQNGSFNMVFTIWNAPTGGPASGARTSTASRSATASSPCNWAMSTLPGYWVPASSSAARPI